MVWDSLSVRERQHMTYPSFKNICETLINIDANLTQIVIFPTRIDNTLDLLFVNCPTQVMMVFASPGISDHDSIPIADLLLKLCMTNCAPRKGMLYKKVDQEAFTNDLQSFINEQYYNGHEGNRTINENWCLIRDCLIKQISR